MPPTRWQAHLAALKRVHAVASKQLESQQQRPSTYAGELSLTAQQRSLKGAMQVTVPD